MGGNRKRLWLIVGVVLLVAGVLLFNPVRQWYRDTFADNILRNIFEVKGLRDVPRSDTELTSEEWQRLAELSEGPMDEASRLMKELGPDAAPGLVKIIVDKSEKDWTRSQAINAILEISNRYTWTDQPAVDYVGLLRVAGDEGDWESHREGAVDLLGLWKYRQAAALFRELLKRAETPATVKRAVQRNFGKVDEAIQEIPEALFDPNAPRDQRRSWLDFAASVKMRDADIIRMEKLVWERDLSNPALMAIGAQKTITAEKVIGDVLMKLAEDSARSIPSPSRAITTLLNFNTPSSREIAERSLVTAIQKGRWNIVDEWTWAIKKSGNGAADVLIKRALEESKNVGGDTAMLRLQSWLDS